VDKTIKTQTKAIKTQVNMDSIDSVHEILIFL